jgi:hypothetical protein
MTKEIKNQILIHFSPPKRKEKAPGWDCHRLWNCKQSGGEITVDSEPDNAQPLSLFSPRV